MVILPTLSVRTVATTAAAIFLFAACTSTDNGDDNASDDPATPEASEPSYELIEPAPDPTPIEPSADVRIGTLDNGLTYYVRRNDRPGQSLALRLVVNAGSLQQDVPDSGGAHFLEHMLFNGTERWPDNEMDRVLQRLGIELGPDLNAYTSPDETVYQLNVSGIDAEKTSTAFDVLRQWASAATITEQATIEERGVVREEIRLRDEGPQGALSAVFDAAYHDGTAYENREPGGRDELILETTADQLRTFYDRWYRPDLMAVVAVGDLPLDEMEAAIVERFSDVTSRGDDRERTEPEVAPIDTTLTDVVSHPELSSSFVSVDYSLTDWRQATIGGERLTYIQDLIALMIQNRLQESADRGDVVLIDPSVGRVSLNRSQPILGFNVDGPDLTAVAAHVLTEMNAIERNGFTEDELERVKATATSGLDRILGAATTIEDATHANAYVDHYLRGSEISDVSDTHSRLTSITEELTAQEATDLFRWELSKAAPVVIVAGPDPEALPTTDELDDVVAAAAADDGAAEATDDGPAIESLIAAPDPVEPVAVNELDELDATEWVFENGVTVRAVETDIVAGEAVVRARSTGGWSTLSAEDAVLAPWAANVVAGSGVGDYDRLTFRRFLAGTSASLNPFIGETTEGFSGSSSVEDIEVLFQRLHLAMTAPKAEEAALAEMLSSAADSLRAAESNPNAATTAALADVLFDGDERFASVPPDGLNALTTEKALDLYRSRFGPVDDLVVAFAGDIDTQVIGDLSARYLGTLSNGPDDSWTDVRPPDLEEVVERRLEAGTGEATAAVAVLYPSRFDVDAETRVQLEVLGAVLDARLFDVVREELGASYGGSVLTNVEVAPREGATITLFANGDPERADEILQVMGDESGSLAAEGPTDDELQRAKAIIGTDFELVNNNQMVEMLLTDPGEDALTMVRRSALLATVEATDIKALAEVTFPTDSRVDVITLPG